MWKFALPEWLKEQDWFTVLDVQNKPLHLRQLISFLFINTWINTNNKQTGSQNRSQFNETSHQSTLKNIVWLFSKFCQIKQMIFSLLTTQKRNLITIMWWWIVIAVSSVVIHGVMKQKLISETLIKEWLNIYIMAKEKS